MKEALPKLRDDNLRQQLLLESSRIEVEAVLEKIDSLKTDGAKRRNLVAALDAIRADPVPDELQAAEIAMLEDALRELDAEGGPS